MVTAGYGSVPETALEKVQGYPLRAFLICMVAYTTAQMDLALFGYAVPAIRAEFELALSEVMAIVSIAFLIGGALLLGLGWMGDRVGRLPMFQFSLLGSSVLVTLISVAPGVIVLTLLTPRRYARNELVCPSPIRRSSMPSILYGLEVMHRV